VAKKDDFCLENVAINLFWNFRDNRIRLEIVEKGFKRQV
jgi:hypothetical protein